MALRVWNLVRKELIQLFRDWVMTALILTLPVSQLALLAYVTGSSLSDLRVAVLDIDRSSASRRLVDALDNRDELVVRRFASSPAEIRRFLDQGVAVLGVTIPADFSADLADASRTPCVQLVADASNYIAASHALGAGRAAVAAFSADLAASRGLSTTPIVELRTTVRFNPTFNVRYFTVPAQVGFIIYQVTLTVAAISLARERELGTLEQLLVMPLRRTELLIGKALPASVIGCVNFLLMLAVSVLAFGVPLRGSPLLLGVLTLLFILVEISYGMLISSVAHTQQQAMLLVFVMAMVDMTFSGYMVRVRDLPVGLRAIAQVVPFNHYLTAIRGIMLKGAGLGDLWPHVAAMLAMGLVVSAAATRSLRHRLD